MHIADRAAARSAVAEREDHHVHGQVVAVEQGHGLGDELEEVVGREREVFRRLVHVKGVMVLVLFVRVGDRLDRVREVVYLTVWARMLNTGGP